jgi:hypothetical protein
MESIVPNNNALWYNKGRTGGRFMKNLTLMDILVLFLVSYFLPPALFIAVILAYRSGLAAYKWVITEPEIQSGTRFGFSMFCLVSIMAIGYMVHLG